MEDELLYRVYENQLFMLEKEQERMAYQKITSTPFVNQPNISPALSRILSSEDENVLGKSSDMSGIEVLNSDSGNDHPRENKKQTASFVDPFQISIEISADEGGDSSDDSDDDYEPSMNITLGPVKSEKLETLTLDGSVFGSRDDNDSDDSDTADDDNQSDEDSTIPGIIRILSPENQTLLTVDRLYLVYQQPMLNLARVRIESCNVKGCSGSVELTTETLGSAFYIKWVCKSGHLIYKWCSQPLLNRRLHGGDLLLSASVLLSGNNFTKMSLFARFLKLSFVSSCIFHRIQRFYLVPSIDSFWEEKQGELLNGLGDDPIVVLGLILSYRSTAELENFQNHILMYASKRFAYTPPVYRARNQLAALDYNEHVDRACHLNEDGSKRYQRLFNKKSSRWTVVEMKTAKQYSHIPHLISKIVTGRLEDITGMQGLMILADDDPRRISRNITSVPPPPTKDLVQQKKSRLKEEESE